MIEMINLGWRELAMRKRAALGLILGVAVVLLVFLAIESVTYGISQTFAVQQSDTLLVLPSKASAVWGSYLPKEYQGTLRRMGARPVVPQIYVIRQDTNGQILLFRGFPLSDYAEVTRFRMVEGEPLAPGDRRMVMIGINVAGSKGMGAGDTLSYRGKDFLIKGVFATDLLADSEVWVDLREAEKLFNSQGYVSTFAIRGDARLVERVERRLDVQVVDEGQVWESFNGATSSLYTLLRLVSAIVAGAAVLGVMNMMFTIVKQRQREIAVLRSVGFGRWAVAAYVLAQAMLVSAVGYGLALGVAALFLRGLQMEAMGMTMEPQLTQAIALRALGFTAVISLLAGGYPALLAARLNLAEALRGE